MREHHEEFVFTAVVFSQARGRCLTIRNVPDGEQYEWAPVAFREYFPHGQTHHAIPNGGKIVLDLDFDHRLLRG